MKSHFIKCSTIRMLNREEIKLLLSKVPEGYLKPNNEFFQEGNNRTWQPYKKLGAITNVDAEISEVINKATPVSTDQEIFCSIMGCKQSFKNIASYQMHYNTIHRFHCAECKKSLPTEHLLDIHLTEQHDSFFAACLARGTAVYKCFIEECNITFERSDQRKDHCIKKHNFPGNFRFNEVPTKAKETHKSIIKNIEMNDNFNEHNKPKSRKLYSFGHQKVSLFRSKNKNLNTLDQMDTLKQALEEIPN